MLSHDLKKLADTFERWCTGELYVTEDAWSAFRSEIKTCVARAALLELGIDVKVLDIAAAVAEPDSNIMLFPTPAQRERMTGAARD